MWNVLRIAILSCASAVVGASACAHPVPQAPAPATVTSALSPVSVVQRSAAALTAEGFVVTTSDATAGVLTASQERDAAKMAPEIACSYGPDAIGAQGTRLVLIVSVAATPHGAGSTVTIGARVHEIQGAGPSRLSRSSGSSVTEHCASTGVVEQRLAALLGLR